jgi:hypothetical protein
MFGFKDEDTEPSVMKNWSETSKVIGTEITTPEVAGTGVAPKALTVPAETNVQCVLYETLLS